MLNADYGILIDQVVVLTKENKIIGVCAEEALRSAEENARLTPKADFTAIRCLRAPGLVDIELRERVKRGDSNGPRILASGKPFPRRIFFWRGKRKRMQCTNSRIRAEKNRRKGRCDKDF